MKSKRGQMEISFGMIFSIILIIAFLAFAFYGIQKFIEMKNEVQIKQFSENVKLEVDKMWKSNYGSKDLEYVLPNKAEQVCFKNPNQMSIYYGKRIDKVNLEHVNLEISEDGRDFFCVKVVENKIKFSLTKAYGEPLVKITK